LPALIPSKPTPQTEYVVSLPLSLLSAMSLVCAAPSYEGLASWPGEARRIMPADLRHELDLLISFPGRYQRFTEEVATALLMEQADLDFPAFLQGLQEIPVASYEAMAWRALGKSVSPPQDETALARLRDESEALHQHLAGLEPTLPPEEVAALLKDPAGLKKRFIALVERFWREIYRHEYERTYPLMEHSTVYHRRQNYRLAFPDLFTALTGRLLPDGMAELTAEVERVRFVPSCYIGPYFAYMRHPGLLTVFYNCLATPMSEEAVKPPTLFPILKALADETRLQIMALLRGREMYAQEIVERLGISQAAVSRHLKLMSSAGVLQVRPHKGAKYYSINAEVLRQLSRALQDFTD